MKYNEEFIDCITVNQMIQLVGHNEENPNYESIISIIYSCGKDGAGRLTFEHFDQIILTLSAIQYSNQ